MATKTKYRRSGSAPPPDENAFRYLPNEMYFKIFNYLDHNTALRARMVCRKWKSVLDDARNFRFVCHLTDSSTAAVVNSQIDFHHVKIHDYVEVGQQIMSSTRGLGRIIKRAEKVEISGTDIDPQELRRLMQYGIHTLRQLKFHRTKEAVFGTVIGRMMKWSQLQKLTLSFNTFPFEWHTNVFRRLAGLGHLLPSVTKLKILYAFDSVDELYSVNYVPLPHIMLENYIAIFQLVVGLKRNLRAVTVERNEVIRTAFVLRVDISDVRIGPAHQRIIQNIMHEFDNFQLDSLHFTPLMDEGTYPWILENALMRQQRSLKRLYLNRKLCARPRLGVHNLTGFLPLEVTHYTSVKISMHRYGSAPVNLSVFSQCPNLRTLWLAFYRGVRVGPARQNTLHFSNVESLPTGIRSLHFKSSQSDPIIIHQQSILQRSQVLWIIENMRNLESFWLQLVTEENDVVVGPSPAPDGPLPPNQGEIFVLNADGGDIPVEVVEVHLNDEEALEAQNLVNQLNNELNTNANINLRTFRQLLSLPLIKDLKLDLLKAEQLGAILELGADGNPWILPGLDASPRNFSDYLNIIQEFPRFVYQTQVASFFPFRFVELTISRK